ncbi:cardiolipin synthase [Pseudohyphozyma bogoriensis]|nr:cardiolipin synthase [Pseudohyphozyma bogoriensis]
MLLRSSTRRLLGPHHNLARPLACARLASRFPTSALPPSPPLRFFSSTRSLFSEPTPSAPPSTPPPIPSGSALKKELRENIYTIPNALTLSRIFACPAIGYFVLQGQFKEATGLLFVAGVTDLLDGWLARKYKMGSVLGSILDPAADKLLMTTMVVTLTMKGMLPCKCTIKTFKRYWDFGIPSAEVHPTDISKYNTALQLLLVGATTVAPLIPADLTMAMMGLQWTVAGTTIASGLSYVFSSKAVKYIK